MGLKPDDFQMKKCGIFLTLLVFAQNIDLGYLGSSNVEIVLYHIGMLTQYWIELFRVTSCFRGSEQVRHKPVCLS